MKKIVILGAVAVLLISGLAAAGCGSICDNYGDCRWTKDDNYSDGRYSTDAYGKCSKKDCVIQDAKKGLEAFDNKKDILCNCS